MRSRVGSAAVGEAPAKEVAPLIKEGYLWKRGEYIRNWRVRYYILRADGTFHGFKSKEERLEVEEIQNDFKLQKDVTVLCQEKPKPNSFIVQGVSLRDTVVDRMYYADTPEDRELWVIAIQAVVDAIGTSDWKSCVEKIGKKEVRMYDVSLLNSLSQAEQSLSPGLRLRPLQLSDYERGYLELLSRINDTDNMSKSEFTSQFHAMVSSNKYYTTVIEDNSSNRIVSAATLVIELKFDQSHPKVGWIKDFVFDKYHADHLLLKNKLLTSLKDLGERIGCSRVESINISRETQDEDM
ncbi:RAC-beta serine/threonine-protein kinase B-like [Ostrea edulis]|uniref:RAC-beta serine/threonine-protein kinase B-like n=1 Tax=Ostrea edulis TaxID=37623 RepID=UPI0024AF8077|nr:RAC-beta serine/threonine-protein kinase B-like [Ostrea edulis]